MILALNSWNHTLPGWISRCFSSDSGQYLKCQASTNLFLGVLEWSQYFPRPRSVHGLGLWLWVVAATLLGVSGIIISRVGHRKKSSSRSRNAQEALNSIFTPTLCAHPTDYEGLLDYSINWKKHILNINVSNLSQKIASGDFELRDSQALLDMLWGGILVYGWNIRLECDWCWRLRVISFVMASYAPFQHPVCSTSEFHHILSSPLIVDLDFIQPHHLETNIRQIRRQMTPGSSRTVEFTSIASHMRFFGHAYMLCCIPFVSTVDPLGDIKARTATPFVVPTYRMLEFLLSGSTDIVVQSMKNVSQSHATSLRDTAKKLVYNPEMRSAFISKQGIYNWREKHLFLIWEAALLQSGRIVRWEVTLSNSHGS